MNHSNKSWLLYPMSCSPAKRTRERECISHSYLSFHILYLVITNSTTGQPPLPPQHNWEISILLHILEQIPFLITDAFQSRHHYIFRPLSFKMYWKPLCWFPRAPFPSSVMLLLVCFSNCLLGDPHCYSFSVSLTSVWMEFICPIPCSLHYFGDRQLLSGAAIKT